MFQNTNGKSYLVLPNGAWQEVVASRGSFAKVIAFGNPYPMYYRFSNNSWHLIDHMFNWEYRGK